MADPGTSDRKRGRGSTRRSEERNAQDPPGLADVNFWAVFESAPDAYLLLASDPPRFTMVAANEARLRATMTRREDVVGRPLFEVFPDNPDDPAATGVRNLQASLEEVIRTGRPHRMALQKYDIRTPDGGFEERYWDPLNSPVFDGRGRLVYIIHRVEDVTRQVRAGSRLRTLESVVTTANDAVIVTGPDPVPELGGGRRILYVNDAFTRMTGYAPDEIVGRTARVLQGPGTDPETTRRVRDALDRGEPVRAELLNYRKDGSPFWVEISVSPVRDDEGRVVQWTSVQRETTERRQAEETALRLARETAAREEETRARRQIESIRTMLELGNDAHAILDPDGRFLWANHLEAEQLGRSPDELRALRVWDIDPNFDQARYRDLFERARRERVAPFESVNVRPDGSTFPVEVGVTVVDLPEGPRLHASMRDISERRAAEAERERLLAGEREAREQVTTILESIADAFFAVDREWRFTYVNREAERLLQRRRQDLLGRGLWDEFPDALGGMADREYRRALADQVTVAFQQYSVPLAIWVDVRAYPSPEGLSVFFRDVTDQKQAQDRIRESEARFRSLAENANEAIFVIDTESTIEFANPAVEQIFGYTVDEVVGRRLDMLMPADQRPRHDAGVRRYLETGERNIRWEGVELPGLTKDGRVVPLEISMGEFVREGRHYFTGIARDITVRKQAEQAMRESEERFRTLGNSIPQLAWMADPSGWIFWYNDRWHEYTGTTLEDMQGWGWRKVHHPEHVDRVVERIRYSFQTGVPWEDTFPLRGKDGEYRWFLSRALPIRDADGKIVRWFGTNTDITEEMEAAAERERLLERERDARGEAERQREELERVTESRTRLMRGFSHDVKNPLGAADGYAQLLEEGILGELTEKQKDSIRRIRRSIETSLKLIHDLLELARAEAGQIQLERVDTDVSQAAREVAVDFRAQARAAGVDIRCDVPDGLHAETDATRLRQILANLLSNAVKYAPNGRAVVAARAVTNGDPAGDGSRIAVSVTDTGPGIPAEKRELIFQEFTRLDPEAQAGAGVGLAISRRVAQLMGGDLTVESEVGRGSTFTLWLPGAGQPLPGAR